MADQLAAPWLRLRSRGRAGAHLDCIAGAVSSVLKGGAPSSLVNPDLVVRARASRTMPGRSSRRAPIDGARIDSYSLADERDRSRLGPGGAGPACTAPAADGRACCRALCDLGSARSQARRRCAADHHRDGQHDRLGLCRARQERLGVPVVRRARRSRAGRRADRDRARGHLRALRRAWCPVGGQAVELPPLASDPSARARAPGPLGYQIDYTALVMDCSTRARGSKDLRHV